MGDLAKAAGGAVKGAVGDAVQSVKDKAGQIGAQLKDPKAWASTAAATSAKNNAQLSQQTVKYAQQLAKEWSQQALASPDNDDVTPDKDEIYIKPGYKIQVSIPSTGGADKIYFKTEKGWTNEMGQAVTRPKDVAMLEKWADSGAGKEIPIKEATDQTPKISAADYIKQFKAWASKKLATKETNTGTLIDMATVAKEIPELDGQLNTALTAVYNTRQDPAANQQAVVGYLTQAIKGVQQVAAKIRAENPQATASDSSSGGFADPRVGEQLAGQLRLDLAAFKNALGKDAVRPTGNPKLDGLLKAAGVI